MKTRNGKIARLPKEVREQLNHRLENGWRGTRLVKWLNELPEVRQVLREEFHGHPITPQNLSQWREGGYADWLRHQDSREGMRWMLERAEDLKEEPGEENFCERLARVVTVEVAAQVQRLDKIEDPKERWRELREVCLELWRLRNATSYGQSVALGRQQWQRKVGQEEAALEEDKISEPAEGEQSQEAYLENLMDQLHNPEIREWVRTDWPNREAEFLRLKEIYDLKPDSKDTPFHPSQGSEDGLRRSAVYKYQSESHQIKVDQSDNRGGRGD
ncbi:MAG TPA: hypothetical protein VH597_13770 [Verrucomicrobiae bacterium]|jgi:hypothetical protein|nr:hypothetical protein [Verrucomicrobiae bacterium]